VSALTKVFVLLLVLLSIIQTAGVVVFVNREQNLAANLRSQKDSFLAAKAGESAAADALAAKEQQYTNIQAELQNVRNLNNQMIEQLRGAAADKDAQIAQLTSQSQLAMAAQKGATDALAVAQKSIDSQNQQIADLRKIDLDMQKNSSENSIALAEMTNKFDTVNRQWRDALEQNTQLQNETKNLHGIMNRSGINENSPTINTQSLVQVEGVVNKRESVNGVQMATISIGSADQVTKGMQLKVIDPTSSDPFLAYIEVDRVEPNQAIGHLTGPHVDRVRPGSEVRSQL
jgi:hypothetical protein